MPATLQPVGSYRLINQGRTKPFHDIALVYGHLVRLAQPIMTAYQSDLFYDAVWLDEHASNVQPGESFAFHWHVSNGHTSIHAEDAPYNAYEDKKHYVFRLYLAESGWWTLDIDEA